MKKHDCIEWREEGMGCSVCAHSHLLTIEDIKEVQQHSNWYITSLKTENAKLKRKIKQLLNPKGTP